MLEDLRHALRGLRRARLVSVVVVLILALGIGALTTIFSFVDSLLLRPVPYPEPSRLVSLAEEDGRSYPFNSMRWAAYEAVRDRARSFETVAAFRETWVNLYADGMAEQVVVSEMSTGAFAALRARPQLGRLLGAEDLRPGAPAVVVIGHGLWQSRFGGRADILGRSVVVAGVPATIVGVMPRDFGFYERSTLWRPLVVSDATEEVQVMARLRDGATLEAARAEVAAIGAALAAGDLVADGERYALRVRDGIADRGRGGLPPQMVVLLFGAAAFVLLVACANVANLLLARNVARRRETAIRGALGAGRGRLLRQGLTESVVLAAVGTALGVAIAVVGVHLMSRIAVPNAPTWVRFGVEWRALLVAIAAAVTTVLVFGVPAALDGSRANLVAALGTGGVGAGGAVHRARLRRLLVGAEMAMAVVLVAGTFMLARSQANVAAVDPGIPAEQLLRVRVSLDEVGYPTAESQRAYREAAVARLAATPGVEDAAWSGQPRHWIGGDTTGGMYRLATDATPAGKQEFVHLLDFQATSANYLATKGLRLVAGRAFASDDRAGAPPVAVVSEALGRRLWPDASSPVGQRIRLGSDAQPWATVVGVVSDERTVHTGFPRAGISGLPVVYLHAEQVAAAEPEYLVRMRGAAEAGIPAVHAAIASLDPMQPATLVRPVIEELRSDARLQRWMTGVFGALAATALCLAVLGLYGVVAYGVAQRVPEIGVRLALGARPADVARMVVRETLRLAVWGLAIGVALHLVAGRMLRFFAVGVSPSDPATLVAVVLFFGALATAVSWVPARRATRVDPAMALRSD